MSHANADKQKFAFGMFLTACRDLIEGRVVKLWVAPDIYGRIEDQLDIWEKSGGNGLYRESGKPYWKNIELASSPRDAHYDLFSWLKNCEADVASSPFMYRKASGTIEQIDPGWMAMISGSESSQLPKSVLETEHEEIDRYITLKKKGKMPN
jgi:hypothetical protein